MNDIQSLFCQIHLQTVLFGLIRLNHIPQANVTVDILPSKISVTRIHPPTLDRTRIDPCSNDHGRLLTTKMAILQPTSLVMRELAPHPLVDFLDEIDGDSDRLAAGLCRTASPHLSERVPTYLIGCRIMPGHPPITCLIRAGNIPSRIVSPRCRRLGQDRIPLLAQRFSNA